MSWQNDDGAPVWAARWIWKSAEVRVNDFARFRREFALNGEVARAEAWVSAHNHFELYVNGTRVSGLVTPAPTHPEKSKYYLRYDIAGLLRPGPNAFCAEAHFLGGGGQNYVNGLPGFLLQCRVVLRDGTEALLITDESWKARETPYADGMPFQQNRKMSAIERYDARLEEPGWLLPGFDDSHWQSACLSPIKGAGWVLKPQTIPEGRVHELIVPTPVGVQEEGVQVFDAGKIVTGWPRLRLAGAPGVCVRTRYSEDLDGQGRVGHNVANEHSENYYDEYILRGEGEETWEPRFSYKAFRYVEVTGFPGRLSPGDVQIVSAGTGVTRAGLFDSSSGLLNAIYRACVQTQLNNVVGQMVDCPHREQAQYLADSDLQAETYAYTFREGSVLEKVLLDFADAQNEDGRLPFVFPTNTDNPDFNIKIPEWDLHFITLLKKVRFLYDDCSILEQCYGTAQRIIALYVGLIDATGLIPKAVGFPVGWNISDWPYPDIDETGPYLTVQNCLFYHTLTLMAEFAAELGRQDDRARYLEQAARHSQAILKHLYVAEEKQFQDCYGSAQSHQGTNVAAFQYGLVPAGDREAVLARIAAQGFGCSTLLSLNLLQVLFENGRGAEAYALIDRTAQPGWGYMVSQGHGTIWEGFQDIESHCHAWNAYPARILVEYVVGIRAAAPGFRAVEIKPFLAGGLQYAEGTLGTVSGDIRVRWERTGEGVRLMADIPVGVAATVRLPAGYGHATLVGPDGAEIWRTGQNGRRGRWTIEDGTI